MSTVIKQFRQKNGDNFSSPINLGADQRYVGPLRQSNNDNLEEQTLLGVDCITTESWNGTTHIIKKEFHDGTQSTDFYILTTEVYDDNVESFVSNQNLILTNNDFEITNTFKTIRKDILSYKNSNGEEIEISTKITQRKESNGVIITKEVIERKENINGNN